MPILAQILTADITGKYKVNLIKNSKFLEMIYTSNIYTDILANKFEYVSEINTKEKPILRYLSAIVNCEFTLIDPNPEVNGQKIEDIVNSDVANEFLLFLSII